MQIIVDLDVLTKKFIYLCYHLLMDASQELKLLTPHQHSY